MRVRKLSESEMRAEWEWDERARHLRFYKEIRSQIREKIFRKFHWKTGINFFGLRNRNKFFRKLNWDTGINLSGLKNQKNFIRILIPFPEKFYPDLEVESGKKISGLGIFGKTVAVRLFFEISFHFWILIKNSAYTR